MAWTMWYVVVSGNIVGIPMEYAEALELETQYRLKGFSAHMIKANG